MTCWVVRPITRFSTTGSRSRTKWFQVSGINECGIRNAECGMRNAEKELTERQILIFSAFRIPKCLTPETMPTV